MLDGKAHPEVAQIRAGGNAPAAGLEAEQAATGSRGPDRAPAVIAVGQGHHACRHCGCRAATGPSRRAREVPGILARPEQLRLGDRRQPELGYVGFADDDQARRLESCNEFGVMVCHVVGEKPAALADRLVCAGRHEVLQQEGDTSKRAFR